MLKSDMRKFRTGLVIGRFQPFHKGHEYLFKEAFKLCDQLIVGIGSANKSNDDNPWKASKRKRFIQKFLQENGYESRVKKIVFLYDNPDDDVWFENLYKKTGHFDVTIGNNDWNNGIIERHGIPAIKHGFAKRHIWEGIKIRGLMREHKKWEDRVPEYLVPSIDKI